MSGFTVPLSEWVGGKLSLHLQFWFSVLVPGDGEVESDVDDGGQVEEEEGGDQQQGLIDHGAVCVGEPGHDI